MYGFVSATVWSKNLHIQHLILHEVEFMGIRYSSPEKVTKKKSAFSLNLPYLSPDLHGLTMLAVQAEMLAVTGLVIIGPETSCCF